MITCRTETEFDIHINGTKHKKKVVESLNPGSAFESKTDAIEANLDALNEPVIGLEYIEEFQFIDATHNELRFNCHICKISTLTTESVSAHVVSVKHRRRYTKLKYPNFHTEIVVAGNKISSQKDIARKHAQQIEDTYGRQQILRAGQQLPSHIHDLFDTEPLPQDPLPQDNDGYESVVAMQQGHAMHQAFMQGGGGLYGVTDSRMHPYAEMMMPPYAEMMMPNNERPHIDEYGRIMRRQYDQEFHDEMQAPQFQRHMHAEVTRKTKRQQHMDEYGRRTRRRYDDGFSQ